MADAESIRELEGILKEMRLDYQKLAQELGRCGEALSAGTPPKPFVLEALQAAREDFDQFVQHISKQVEDVPAFESLEEIEGFLSSYGQIQEQKDTLGFLKRAMELECPSDPSKVSNLREQVQALLAELEPLNLDDFEKAKPRYEVTVYAVRSLLDLVERRNDLPDDVCEKLVEEIGKVFPLALALAALRSHLVLPASGVVGAAEEVVAKQVSEPTQEQVAEKVEEPLPSVELIAEPVAEVQQPVSEPVPVVEAVPIPESVAEAPKVEELSKPEPAPAPAKLVKAGKKNWGALAQSISPSWGSEEAKPAVPSALTTPAPVPVVQESITVEQDNTGGVQEIAPLSVQRAPVAETPAPARTAASAVLTAVNTPSLTQSLFTKLYRDIEQVFFRTPNHEIIMGVLTQSKMGPCDFKEVPKDRTDVIAQVLQTWFAIQREYNCTQDEIKGIMRFFGYNVVDAVVSNPGPPLAFKAVVDEVGNHEQMYQVVCFWGRPTEDMIMQEALDPTRSKRVIFFHFGCLSSDRRDAMSKICYERSKEMLLVDDILLLYLCSLGVCQPENLNEGRLPFQM
jgi:hypothetical protein